MTIVEVMVGVLATAGLFALFGAGFGLRADAHPLDHRSEAVGHPVVVLVGPVVADLLPEQAGADADPDRASRRLRAGGAGGH